MGSGSRICLNVWVWAINQGLSPQGVSKSRNPRAAAPNASLNNPAVPDLADPGEAEMQTVNRISFARKK